MKPLKTKIGNPEKKIQIEIETMLRRLGWYVVRTHGNSYQSGIPDNFITHRVYGQRWVEVKLPDMKGSKFTQAQFDVFPKMLKNGCGIWVLTEATKKEYEKLFKPCNLFVYMRPK